MNQKGSALLLALVLTMSVLPTAGVLAYIARSDLESALEDYHFTRARYAVQASLTLIAANLLDDGEGQVLWPDPTVCVVINIIETATGWQITVTAHSGKAVAQAFEEVDRPGEEALDERQEVSERDSDE